MTNCLKTSYNEIPTSLAEFQTFVNDLAARKMAEQGEKNPCKDVPSDRYDSPDTPIACKKLAHDTRWHAANYARNYLREAAAREMDPLYNGQMMARDGMREAAIGSHRAHHTAHYVAVFGALDNWANTLTYAWQWTTDQLGFGSAADFLEDMKAGKNLNCIGKKNICTAMEDEINKIEHLYTRYKVTAQDDHVEQVDFAILNTLHVLFKNRHDPDGCKESMRVSLGEIGSWMGTLDAKLIVFGLRPEPAEEESVAETDTTTPDAEAAPLEPLLCTPVTQKALVEQLRSEVMAARVSSAACAKSIQSVLVKAQNLAKEVAATRLQCTEVHQQCSTAQTQLTQERDAANSAARQQEARAAKAELALDALRAQQQEVARTEPQSEAPAHEAPAAVVKPKPKVAKPRVPQKPDAQPRITII